MHLQGGGELQLSVPTVRALPPVSLLQEGMVKPEDTRSALSSSTRYRAANHDNDGCTPSKLLRLLTCSRNNVRINVWAGHIDATDLLTMSTCMHA